MIIYENKNKGFTIIELIVVIAIIAILAAVVSVNVNKYIKNAKISRATKEFNNMKAAATEFYVKYGDYPNSTESNPGTDPFLIIDSNTYYLSEFYKVNWSDASYICSDCQYVWYWYDKTCIYGIIRNLAWNRYIYKNLICEGCPYSCNRVYHNF